MSYQDLKSRMVAHLKKWARGMVDSGEGMNFSIESAIYWFANDYHNGGGSELYQILSTSKFRPGPSHRSVDDEGDEIDKMMYEELERYFIPKGRARNNGHTGVRKNPPSFILIDKETGLVVYTKRATGVGSAAISACVKRGHELADQHNRVYTVFLDIRGLSRGMKVHVPAIYALGITEEIHPGGQSVRPNSRGAVRKNIFTFNNPKLKFSDLSVGETFVFASQDDPKFLTSGMARGPWIKRSARTYEHVDDVGKQISERRYGGGHIAVGSASVGVKRMSLGRELPKLCPHCDASYIGTPQMHKFECAPQGGANLYQENPRRRSARRNPTMGSYEVFVGNIGQVYDGNDRAKAQHSFDYYVAMSKRTSGRASGEDVALLCEGELSQEYIGSKGRERGDHRRGVRRNIFTFNNPPSGPADPAAARELEVYIENDADLYRQQFVPIVKNLMLKRRKGVYNRELAVKLFMYLMDAGAKKYVAEYVRSSSPGAPMPKIDGTFNKNTRLMAARSFLESFEGEAELGNYDRMIGPVSNPRGANVRKNIFTFNNPKQRPLNEMENAASLVGLTVTTWAPGDGVTRYRFFKAGGSRYADYHQGGALYTALGRKEAIAFIKSYGVGRSRMNPLNQKEIEQMRDRERFYVGRSQKYGSEGKEADAAHFRGAAQESRNIRERHHAKGTDWWPNPPVCSNPLVRGDKLPHNLRMEVRNRFIYRWTSDNDRRAEVYGLCPHCKTRGGKPSETNIACRQVHPTIPLQTDEQWLKTHAFHVTKAGRLSERHNHAEPGYMADDETRKNPMSRREAAGEIREIRGARSKMRYFHRLGRPEAAEFQDGYAHGVAGAVYRRGPKSARRVVDRAVRSNPLLQTVMLANPGSVKTFSEMQDVGKAKYVVNYHDGVKVHRDGSPFFDIAIFSNRAKKDQFVRKLESLGFTRGALRNPPISTQWDRMTRRQREALLEIVGYDRDFSGGMTLSTWGALSPAAKRKLEAQWLDTTSSGGTTRRRRRSPVAVNPLTRKEAASTVRSAKFDLRYGSAFAPGHTRSGSAGRAFGKATVVRDFGPRSAGRAASKIMKRSVDLTHAVRTNPGIKYPKPGTKMTVAQAMDLARRIGNKDLIKQCEEAAKLQKVANRGAKVVIWKELPIGSPNKIDMVTAFAHYGDSPETMYRPPKGSKKGPHMYRHKWGEGTGKKKSVPILAAPGGKALITLMGSDQKTGDWMRG